MNLEKTLTSNEIADMVDRRHDQVLRDIENIVEQLGDHKSVATYFEESTYINSQNKTLPNYLLTKKGCELYGSRMNGRKGTLFAVAYIDKFNQMEVHIKKEQQKLPSSPMEILELTFAAQKETNERVDAIEDDIKDIKENQLITTEDKNSIDRMVKNKVYQICKDMRLSNEAKKLLFADLGSSIKQLFNVPHRGRIRAKDYSKAVDFVSTWEPNSLTKQRIKDLNLFE